MRLYFVQFNVTATETELDYCYQKINEQVVL